MRWRWATSEASPTTSTTTRRAPHILLRRKGSSSLIVGMRRGRRGQVAPHSRRKARLAPLPHIALPPPDHLLLRLKFLLLIRLLQTLPTRSAILDDTIIALERDEGTSSKGDDFVREVFSVVGCEKVGDEADGGGGAEVELRGDGDEVGREERDVDRGEHLELSAERANKGERGLEMGTRRVN